MPAGSRPSRSHRSFDRDTQLASLTARRSLSLACMKKLVPAIAIALVALAANAQPRDTWVRHCQAKDAELRNSNGYRVCTELYVVELEKKQARLLADILRRLGSGQGDDVDLAPTRERLMDSQKSWRNYVLDHCRVVQAVSGDDGPVGDAFPSCSADAHEARNKQLARLLKALLPR